MVPDASFDYFEKLWKDIYKIDIALAYIITSLDLSRKGTAGRVNCPVNLLGIFKKRFKPCSRHEVMTKYQECMRQILEGKVNLVLL